MKVVFKKIIICLLLFILLFNFVFQPKVQAMIVEDNALGTFLDWISGFADGWAGLSSWLYRFLIMIAEAALLGIMTGVATVFGYVDEYGNYAAVDHNINFFTPDAIFFNKILLTDANVFNIQEGMPDPIIEMRTNIALWYLVMRVIAVSILLGILIFIAIRMSISTIASDKAKYKEMLVNWASSIALVFLLHYVIIGGCTLNSALVSILHKIYNNGINLESGMGSLLLESMGLSFVGGWSAIVVLGMLTIQTFAFLIYYIKRLLTICFLVIISPLITITYSIDKLGDGKAQALNTWMKEFFFTIVIQPFHCIIYMVFMSMAIAAFDPIDSFGEALDLINPLGDGFGIDKLVAGILSILCMKFVWDAEKIVKNIFGIKVSESLGDAVASAAVAGAAVSKGMGLAKGAAGAAGNIKKIGAKTGLGKMVKDKMGNTALGKKVGDLRKGMTLDGKLDNINKKIKAEYNKGNKTNYSKIQSLLEKQERLRKVKNGEGLGGFVYSGGQSIKGAVGNVKGRVNDFMSSEKGQIFKRQIANSAGIAASVMAASMTYGASDKTSLVEAGIAGYGFYGATKNGVAGLLNRKRDNYEDEVKSSDKILCDARGDKSERTAEDMARDRMYATVRDKGGELKKLSEDRENAMEALAKLLRDNGRSDADEVAKATMMDLDNGIFNKNLNCDAIAASINIDPSELRGAVGKYAEAKICKNMAKENEDLDTLYGQEGYHAAVLQAFAGKEIDVSDRETQTETQTETKTETETTSETVTENQNPPIPSENNNPPQTQTTQDLADEILQKIKDYLEGLKQGTVNNNAYMDKFVSLLQGKDENTWGDEIEKMINQSNISNISDISEMLKQLENEVSKQSSDSGTSQDPDIEVVDFEITEPPPLPPDFDEVINSDPVIETTMTLEEVNRYLELNNLSPIPPPPTPPPTTPPPTPPLNSVDPSPKTDDEN